MALEYFVFLVLVCVLVVCNFSSRQKKLPRCKLTVRLMLKSSGNSFFLVGFSAYLCNDEMQIMNILLWRMGENQSSNVKNNNKA